MLSDRRISRIRRNRFRLPIFHANIKIVVEVKKQANINVFDKINEKPLFKITSCDNG